MINIVFEGSTGSGKTTIIKELRQRFETDGLNVGFTNDIDVTTPLYSVINSMFQENVLVTSADKFSTVQYETLVQAADYLFLRERIYSKNNDINLLDRNFCSVISYQSVLMEKELLYAKEFMNNLLKSILLGEKNVDLIVYFDMPMEKSLSNSEKRDGRKYTDDEKRMLVEFNNRLKALITTFYHPDNLFIVDFDYTIEGIVEILYKRINTIQNKKSVLIKRNAGEIIE